MQTQDYLAAMGVSEGFTAGLATTELGLLALTVILLSASFVLCMLAFRAAGAARRANIDAAQMLSSIEDYVIEVRSLTAQAERASLRFDEHTSPLKSNTGLSDRIHSVRLGGAEMAVKTEATAGLSETDIAVSPIDETPAPTDIEDEQSDNADQVSQDHLGQAKTPESDVDLASEPTARFRRLLRRG